MLFLCCVIPRRLLGNATLDTDVCPLQMQESKLAGGATSKGQDMENVLKMVSNIQMLLQANTSTHKNEMTKLMEANAALMKENDELRKSKAALTMKVDSVKWKTFPKPDQHRHALIGSTIIRD